MASINQPLQGTRTPKTSQDLIQREYNGLTPEQRDAIDRQEAAMRAELEAQARAEQAAVRNQHATLSLIPVALAFVVLGVGIYASYRFLATPKPRAALPVAVE